MRAHAITTALALLVCLRAPAPATADSSALVLADFEAATPDTFPSGWETRDAEGAARVYRVVRDGENQYLAASAHAESVQIGLDAALDLAKYPYLSWRWRIGQLPKGGNEREKERNDSAAGVYVVFRGGFGGLVPRALKYVWSASQPIGASFASPGYRNSRIVVLRSGAADAGSWQSERVDVDADYRRLFEEAPPEVRGIAILTDGDDTGSTAAADYDDFRALPRSSSGAAAPSS